MSFLIPFKTFGFRGFSASTRLVGRTVLDGLPPTLALGPTKNFLESSWSYRGQVPPVCEGIWRGC